MSSIYAVPLARGTALRRGTVVPVNTSAILGRGVHHVQLVVDGEPCVAAASVRLACSLCGPTLLLPLRVRAAGAVRMVRVHEGDDLRAVLRDFCATHGVDAEGCAQVRAHALRRLEFSGRLGAVRNALAPLDSFGLDGTASGSSDAPGAPPPADRAHPAARDERVVLIGLGTVRSGTTSLAQLLNSQPSGLPDERWAADAADAQCTWRAPSVARVTHEWRQCDGIPWPHTPSDWARAPGRAYRRLAELLEREGSLVGDVASWHLPYARDYLRLLPAVRVVALRRARDETIASISRFFRWQRHMPWVSDEQREAMGAAYAPSAYDCCFPTYREWPATAAAGAAATAAQGDTLCLEGDRSGTYDEEAAVVGSPSLEEAAGRYYDDYYAQVDALHADFPERVAVFESPAVLNSAEAAAALFAFLRVRSPAFSRVDVHSGRPDLDAIISV